MSEKIKRIKGIILLHELDIETGKKTKSVWHNMIMQAYYNLCFQFLNADNLSLEGDELSISHLALGTGTTAPVSTNTKLETEIYRQQPTTKLIGQSSFTTKTVIAPSDGIGTIREIGLFSNGTGTADSGTLLSRAMINKQKTATLQWTLEYKYLLS
jgi:hypothetical protein